MDGVTRPKPESETRKQRSSSSFEIDGTGGNTAVSCVTIA